ncbi:MAG: carboxypeptidase-like regulatory domain-containing protein [Planctomycetota bacterium]
MKHPFIKLAAGAAAVALLALLLVQERSPVPEIAPQTSSSEPEEAAQEPPIAPPEPETAERTPIAPDGWTVDRDRDLHGIVTDADGRPIDGASVTITGTGLLRSSLARHRRVSPEPVVTLKSDAQGR